jgi:exodeoxyribonuclease VII large subunit
VQTERLQRLAVRLQPAVTRTLDRAGERLVSLAKLHQSVDPDRPLARGFARVHRADGSLVRSAATPESGETVRLVFGDGARGAVIDGTPAVLPAPPAPAPRPARVARPPSTPSNQGDLF